MTDKAWKAYERRVAKDHNTHRTPLSGINSRHTSSDSLSDIFYIEDKWTGKKTSMFYPVYRESILIGKPFEIHFLGMNLTVFLTKFKDKEPIKININDHPKWKIWSVWSFFKNDVCMKARKEKKIPYLSIHIKYKKGDVIICRSEDYKLVWNERSWSKPERGN